MKLYRVAGGVAKFGPGQHMLLTPAQIVPRRAVLELRDGADGSADTWVTTITAVEFKVGEVIGLPELERRLVDILVPLEEPTTEAEQHAVNREQGRQAEADKAKAAEVAAKKKK